MPMHATVDASVKSIQAVPSIMKTLVDLMDLRMSLVTIIVKAMKTQPPVVQAQFSPQAMEVQTLFPLQAVGVQALYSP
jgi:hypothetical protein